MPVVVDLCDTSSDDDDDVICLVSDLASRDTEAKRASSINDSSAFPSQKKAKLKHPGVDITYNTQKDLWKSNNDDSPVELVSEHGKSYSSKLAKSADASSTIHRPRVSLVYLNALGNDQAQIRDGVIQGMVLCAKSHTSSSKIVFACSCHGTACSTLPGIRHIKQPDRWSCGFRNTQMLMSAILPLLPSNHSYWKNQSQQPAECQALALPSLRQVQQSLEGAWNQGFDPSGAEYYCHKIVGKSRWIGAVEVWSILSYFNIDAEVVQFINCPESRQLLGPFCLAHFGRPPKTPCLICQATSSSMYAQNLLHIAEQQATRSVQRSCTCCSLPFYLQWKGHSVTVVGVQYDSDPSTPTHLLLLDPICSVDDSKTKSNLISKKPLAFFASRDVQVVVASPRQREGNHKACHAVTAARDFVMRSLARR